MHMVEVTKQGLDIGTISFRGLSSQGKRRLFKCSPKGCVPKTIVQKIAERLTAGVRAGSEEDFSWHI